MMLIRTSLYFVSCLSLVQSWTPQEPLARSSLSRVTISSTTSLNMASRTRGLEKRREGASPMEGGMTLYLKAGPDGTSVGDCPFAHFIRLVLEEKGLEYDLKPSVADTKPNWLIEHYDGKLPALQHRKECYVESGVIAEYLDFFFATPSLKAEDKSKAAAAEEAIDGLFPAVAKYLKTDGDNELLENLQTALTKLETYLSQAEADYLCGDNVCMLDLGLMPKLYHLQVGIEGFKGGVPSMTSEYPQVSAYMERATARPSFQATVYPKETVLWGWGNARS